MEFSFLLLLLLSFIISISVNQASTKTCTENDIKTKITNCNECNKKNSKSHLTKIVFFYLDEECENSNEITLPKPILKAEWNSECNSGTFLDYDISGDKTLKCSKCPRNTYSYGPTFRICGKAREWRTENLKKFLNNCVVVYKDNTIDRNRNCLGWQPSSFGSHYVSGFPLIPEVSYLSELRLDVTLKRKGNVKFNFF